jgi:arsenate reductase
MKPITIYHNPRCSKSRAACELIAAHGIEAEVIDYLATPPSREELLVLLDKLGMEAEDIVRRSEAVFKESYAGREMSDEQWLDALIAHPILIERPIVVRGDKAVIGRPTEKVIALLDADAAPPPLNRR